MDQSPSEQPVTVIGQDARAREPSSPRPHSPPNRSNWSAKEPTGLLQLEALAQQAMKNIEKYGIQIDYEQVMDWLRQRHNLNFIVMCEMCGRPHAQDELVAPER